MLKKLPPLLTDEDAERFVDEADLSEYDLSGGFRMRLIKRGGGAASEPRIPGTDGTVVLTLSKEELDQAIEEAWEARQPLGLYLSQVVRDFLNPEGGVSVRIVDGHDAAVFVQRIKGLLEHPATLWMG